MEIWKPVKEYEGLYEVSNTGSVRRLTTIIKIGNRNVTFNGKIMNQMDNGKGYLRVKLSKKDRQKSVMVHRIIAEAFIENPKNYKVVNHINGIKIDNRIENLEWCTQSQNCLHAIRTNLRQAKTKEGYSVINTRTGEEFSSIKEAAKSSGYGCKCKSLLALKLYGKLKNNTHFILKDNYARNNAGQGIDVTIR